MDKFETSPPDDRQGWMGLLARARDADLLELWHALDVTPEFSWLRVPEVGAVMVQGRMGGTGAPFNLGEMTVTRCSLALADGPVGHAYVQGRNKVKAEVSALIDALMQTDQAEELRRVILTPLAESERQERADRAGKAAATKVNFFTMVRGED